ncbi:MAG: glycosyltransferase family 39 protein [Anaerolineales bacterium]
MSHSFFTTRIARTLALVLLFSTSLAIRLYDLTDLPLDFHPTRQLVSIIKARGLYYAEMQPNGVPTWQLEAGISQAARKADIEPIFFEKLMVFTYRYTGEKIWIARIYASLFWLVGGVFLFLLVRNLVSFDGALLSTAYYLLFPYAILGSRSFQPDPLMVMLTLAFWWAFSRWVNSPSWIKALLAGLFGGLAIYIKFSSAFFVIGAALGLALSRFTLRDLLRNLQVWAMAVLGVFPAAAYMIYGIFIAGYLGGQFSGRFIPSLLLDPLNYLAWQTKAEIAAGSLFIALGLLGLLLTKDKRLRIFLYGLWGAYIVYGLFFDYHVATHDYYHLPLIPIVAVSLSPLGDWFFARLTEAASSRWMRGVVYAILIYAMFAVVWSVRNEMKSVDYRPQAAMWAEIGEKLDHKKNVAGLTQDYGSRLQYWGLTTAENWYTSGDEYYLEVRGGKRSFEKLFDDMMKRRDLFLVTDFNELNLQPELKARLATYQIFAEGEGYIIYNLRQAIK